eukprot:CAMPEP_0198355412 /NCGR_PEP_ID=MMETSP1450-20131203/118967_1 /TAXON_ID=753684 ORGANISM="Madagascaria erythrocladiodes, Strain CCMP3234" /NCGR_SAMPLE_ID=MMETSP1450 /ASSEMBLY_ACC=CAM_ASM_001115 /LENGTH=91 /DNA_ID=CAMNT_0044061773 /DNA_START=270 /DNA_END=545 /DNA_ORIENTATION=+
MAMHPRALQIISLINFVNAMQNVGEAHDVQHAAEAGERHRAASVEAAKQRRRVPRHVRRVRRQHGRQRSRLARRHGLDDVAAVGREGKERT